MFNQTSGYSLADIATATGGNNSGFGNDWWWIILLFLFIGMGGNGFGANGRNNVPCATQLDVREATDQQTLISKLDQQTYGLADSTYALNNAITGGFHGVDNALCTLGHQTQSGFATLGAQMAQCCCETNGAIKDSVTQGIMNTNAIQAQIAECCCNLEKSNMQNRFDAQTYNCNTLQAIDKLGDRIIDFMTQDKIATLTAENQSLKFAASQAAQNAFIAANQEAQTAELMRRLATPYPVPAYVVPNPNGVYSPCGTCALT